MTITKHEPLSEERRAELLLDPDVIHRCRSTDKPIRFAPEISVTGYIDTLELLGRRDDAEAEAPLGDADDE